MTDIVIAALITVGGTVFVAVVSVVVQALTTRFVMKSEQQRVTKQIQEQHQAQALQKRTETLVESVAELLSETDPQVKARFDYGRVVTLIHRTQLVLDHNDREEAALNNAIGHLGLELQEYIPHHSKPVEERTQELRQLLGVHAQVATLASRVVRR